MNKNTDRKRDKVLNSGNKKFEFRKEWLIPLVIVAAGLLIVFRPLWSRNGEGNLNFGNSFVSYERVKAKDGKVAIPVSQFTDNKAKYFVYKFPEEAVFFFMLKSSDGVIRAAFDSCDVCFREKKGYRQEGDIMICNNCGQAFPSKLINVEKGGCNPAPLQRQTIGDEVVLHVSDIYEGMKYF